MGCFLSVSAVQSCLYISSIMRCSTHTITKMSLFFGAVAISTMALAVATNHWIIAWETTTPYYPSHLEDEFEEDFNFTMEGVSSDLPEINLLVNTTSNFGLWQVCISAKSFEPSTGFVNGIYVECMSLLKYKTTPAEDTSNQEISLKIADSQNNMAPHFVVNLFLMLLAAIFHVVGAVKASSRTLIGGIIYIIAGLCTAVSIVIYITFVNDGVHYAGPEKENSYFEYRYGWSAYVLTISYLSSQVAAVLCVTLFLQRYPNVNDLVRLIPGLDKKVPKPEGPDQGTLI
ncbi:voltage-dependent calcium channel gamma-7 subunit-like isoform X2 [Crassostrea angulata]|uniref:voltage-dependent calcium channel gamma-7 subunit-like isoform X2 n=1 Tax=Magallana angulata TaxID=2784310 RepID=UPI0022B177B1|nr:voltage-dependent calcium channel gamma-7 subunit-like isoform X2 [Crassostrea angulata]XP_052690093.1 voltage-dependent calcium channel gamma-7 subunit-like isoform X2 [Crassostrea angulata]